MSCCVDPCGETVCECFNSLVKTPDPYLETPHVLPVTVEDVKAWLRIGVAPAQDAIIETLIISVSQGLECELDMALVPTDFTFKCCYPETCVMLPVRPFNSISEVSLVDYEDNSIVLTEEMATKYFGKNDEIHALKSVPKHLVVRHQSDN